jgi:outer membrane receptor for Fe3+-dicitrate
LLGYDVNGHITNLNRAVKENLKTYFNEYRMLTDGININDGFVINIGLEFEIIVYPNYNKNETLTKAIIELKQYFDVNNWQFNQTINLNEVELLLANIEGVQSVPSMKITNKCGGEYSPNSYNINAATKDKIVYPSLDPSVFEIKFPDADIKGRVR